MVEKLKTSNLSLHQLQAYVTLHEQEVNSYSWLDASNVYLSESEQTRLAFLKEDLQHRRVQLMNEATVWARAIYPLLVLAEDQDIHAHTGISLSAMFQEFEIEVIADGVLGRGFGGSVDSPYLVVVEAKRGVEGQNPLVQLYLEVLAAAHLNWQNDGKPTQELFGCYTVADVWTFLKAEVSGFESPKPALKIEFSREFFEKVEADEICKILKKIVQRYSQPLAVV